MKPCPVTIAFLKSTAHFGIDQTALSMCVSDEGYAFEEVLEDSHLSLHAASSSAPLHAPPDVLQPHTLQTDILRFSSNCGL
jgi:hypothetical protein